MNDENSRVRDTVEGVLRMFGVGEYLLGERTKEGMRGYILIINRMRTHVFPSRSGEGGTLGAGEFRRYGVSTDVYSIAE